MGHLQTMACILIFLPPGGSPVTLSVLVPHKTAAYNHSLLQFGYTQQLFPSPEQPQHLSNCIHFTLFVMFLQYLSLNVHAPDGLIPQGLEQNHISLCISLQL